MKKKLLYCLTALLAFGAVSCKDDDEVMGSVNPAEDFSRMPMTQFRQQETTGKDEGSDPNHCSRVITEKRNSIWLEWYGIEGAAGYEIKYGANKDLSAGTDEVWNNPKLLADHFTVGPDVTSIQLDNLVYDQTYLFAIRVLHPDYVKYDPSTGEISEVVESQKHSKWYGIASQREWARFLRLTTASRYTFPKVINVGNISANRDAFTVFVDARVKTAILGTDAKNPSYKKEGFSSEVEMFEDLKQHFDLVEDGTENDWSTAKFKFDVLKVESANGTVDPQFQNMPIDINSISIVENGETIVGKGEIRVTGLSQNSIYVVNMVNTTRDVAYVDQLANTVRKPVWGDPGEPITITHKSPTTDSLPGQLEFDAMCIDEIIAGFTDEDNTSLPEGTTFYLQGNKAYVISQNISVPKGFILETDPDDIAEGKRAKLYMGGIGAPLAEDGSKGTGIGTSNFMFGRETVGASAPLEVGELIFRNLDIDCPLAVNFGKSKETGVGVSGNYFINMFSNGEEVYFKKFEVDNCTFRGMIRGFIRVQGNKTKVFEQMIIKNCIFYDCGYYDTNGRGYSWFAGDGSQATSNIYQDLQFINNTIYDSPRHAFITDNGKNLEYSVKWNIKIENNTFINFSTRSTKRYFLEAKFIPGGSTFSFKRNLIVLAADDNDKRKLEQYSALLQEVKGDKTFTFDIADNYSVGCRDKHLVDNGIFSSAKESFSAQFGKADFVSGLVSGNTSDMDVKALTDDSGKAMKATDLFNNVNPRHIADPSIPSALDHVGPANIYNDLKYKTVPSIITEKNIGDPRWR